MSRSEVEQAVHEAIKDVLPAVSVVADRHLRDLGADSVDRVEIIMRLMDRFQVCEPMAGFSELRDINALIDHLCEVRQK